MIHFFGIPLCLAALSAIELLLPTCDFVLENEKFVIPDIKTTVEIPNEFCLDDAMNLLLPDFDYALENENPENGVLVPTIEINDESWFNDAIFIGDSFVGSLFNSNLIDGGLGEAKIVHCNGLSCHSVIKKGKGRLISYQGTNHTIAEVVELSEAKKVFLFLAMNDLGQTKETMDLCWDKLIADIREHSPEVDIFIQAGIPLTMDRNYMTNQAMAELNSWLRATCERNGCTYVTISNGMCDENGKLKVKYSTDGTHVSLEACRIWIDNLYNPTNYEVFNMEK